MTTLTQAYLRFRWLHLPGVLLMFLLQRAPMLRAVISTEYVISSTMSTVLKGALSAVAALGAVQTVAGATAIDPAPGSEGNPALGKVGEPFTGGFAIVGAPATAASYEVKGTIPGGLTVSGLNGDTVNASVVTITGTPTQAGDFDLSVKAWKGANKTDLGGSPTFTYTISIAAADTGTAPTIGTQPASQTVNVGANVTFTVTATGDPAPTYQWRKDGTNIGGATAASFSVNNVAATDAGSYTVVVSNSEGSVTSSAAVLTVNAGGGGEGLTITQHPTSANVAAGGNVTFTAAATASGAVTFQWYRDFAGDEDPAPIPGATNASHTINNVQAGDMGYYFARVTGDGETADTAAAILTTTGGFSRLANLSTRGFISAGGSLTPGFVLAGDGTKELVVRAVGPELIDLGLTVGLEDTRMDLIPLSGTLDEVVVSNDNWGDAANFDDTRTAMAAVGAFPLNEGSLDAAVLTDVVLPYRLASGSDTRGYTVQISSTSATASGIALAEVYDPDLSTSQRLVNVSARGFAGTGTNALTPGFVISGAAAKTMLIRVVAPSLARFGVPGLMANPRLSVVPLGQDYAIAENDDWGGTAELKAAFETAGAFDLSSDDSLDAAVLVRLPPGGYTVVVEDVADGTGQVLVEAYEMD